MLTLSADAPPLLEKALFERGESVVLIADPADGEAATVHSANEPWSRLIGRPDGLVGQSLAKLRPFVSMRSQWSAFITALRRFAPIQLDLHLRVDGRDRWLQLRLAFDEDADGNANQALLLGRDMTKARRRENQEDRLHRLLGAVFHETAAAVAVLAGTGEVTMSNPAFQTLLGYTAEGLQATTIGALVAPGSQVLAAASRAKQANTGASFHLRVDLLHRAGTRVPVRLTSTLLGNDEDRRMSVVTALPEPAGARPDLARSDLAGAAKPDLYGALMQPEGEVLALSLRALKAACAAEWARIAPRASLLVEGVMKRRLAAADVFSRTDDGGFIIWFDSRDNARNAAALASIVRDIRLRLVVELGEQIPAPAMAVLLASEPALKAVAPELLETATDAAAIAGASLPARATADSQPILDRSGKPQPWCFVEPASASHRRAISAGSVMEGSPEAAMLRCEAAAAEATAQPGCERVFVRVGWATLAVANHRRAMDEWLARTPLPIRSRLVFAVDGVPPLGSPKRWLHDVSPQQPLLADLVPCLSLTASDHHQWGEAICAWPVTWIGLDGAHPQSLAPDAYFQLIATARRRGLTVLARAAGPAQTRDWFELGANFVAAGA